jgi:hypothetical protein
VARHVEGYERQEEGDSAEDEQGGDVPGRAHGGQGCAEARE